MNPVPVLVNPVPVGVKPVPAVVNPVPEPPVTYLSVKHLPVGVTHIFMPLTIFSVCPLSHTFGQLALPSRVIKPHFAHAGSLVTGPLLSV